MKDSIKVDDLHLTTKYLLVKGLMYGLLIIVLILGIKLCIYNYTIIKNPFQCELREGFSIVTTDALLKGVNPYALENQPQCMNLYGVLYNIFVYPFAKIFGNTMTIHRIVSTFFTVCSVLIVMLVIYRNNKSFLLIMIASLLFYASIIKGYALLAGPNSVGLFLFLGCIFIPYLYRYSFYSLIVSAFLGCLTVYAKSYYFLSVIYLVCYMFLFVSKRKAIIYGFFVAGILLITIILVRYYFECYFNIIIFAQKNCAYSGIGISDYAEAQLTNYVKEYKGTFIIIVAVLMGMLSFRFINLIKTRNIPKIPMPKINIFCLDEPLLNIKLNLILFCFICSFLVIYFVMGANYGAYMMYLYQLISPFLIILVLFYIKRRTKLYFIAILLLLTNLYSFIFRYLPNLDYCRQDWDDVKLLISEHKNVLNHPAVTSILVEQDKSVYDNGHSEYFCGAGSKKSFCPWLFVAADRIAARGNKYSLDIANMIKERKFDLIIYPNAFTPQELLRENYEHQRTISVSVPYYTQRWDLEIWNKKKM